jgi:protein ImuB
VPLAALEWPQGMAATFTRWGLETLGDLARLPREGLGARLGAAGLDAHDRALGVDRAPWAMWTPPAFWEEAQGLDWEIDTVSALAPVLDAVLARLCARLSAAYLVADTLDVRLALTTGGHHVRAVTLAAPLSDLAALASLLVLEIEAHPPAAAVIGVAISAHVLPRRAAPGDLWQPPAPAPRELASVLARLTALLGGVNVGAPVALDSHRPDACTLAAFTGEAAVLGEAASVGDAAGVGDTATNDAMTPDATNADEPGIPAGGALALRRLRPPRPVVVDVDNGRPARVTDPAAGALLVITCAGPWRASGDWWDTDVWARDEWDVALADGTVWRLAHDRLTNQWLLDAVYD